MEQLMEAQRAEVSALNAKMCVRNTHNSIGLRNLGVGTRCVYMELHESSSAHTHFVHTHICTAPV